MNKVRRFKCTKGYGLLGGKEASIWYLEESDSWVLEINGNQMLYKNKEEALRELKNANFEEVI